MNYNMQYKKLYDGEEDTGFSVIASETKGMWRVKYPDGKLSQDHYNLAWAKEHCYYEARRHLEGVQNEQRSSLMRYFWKRVGGYLTIFKSLYEAPIRTSQQVEKRIENVE